MSELSKLEEMTLRVAEIAEDNPSWDECLGRVQYIIDACARAEGESERRRSLEGLGYSNERPVGGCADALGLKRDDEMKAEPLVEGVHQNTADCECAYCERRRDEIRCETWREACEAQRKVDAERVSISGYRGLASVIAVASLPPYPEKKTEPTP